MLIFAVLKGCKMTDFNGPIENKRTNWKIPKNVIPAKAGIQSF